MKELIVGQTVYLMPFGNAGRRSKIPINDTVEEVKRKYYVMSSGRKFEKSTLIYQAGNSNNDFKVFADMESYNDEIKRRSMWTRLRKDLYSVSGKNISLQQLEAVFDLFGWEIPELDYTSVPDNI